MGDVGSALHVFRGTPTVIPVRSVPLQQKEKGGSLVLSGDFHMFAMRRQGRTRQNPPRLPVV
jgi:hypothetical protein